MERVGWDEALDEIASRLGRIAARDPAAILPYSYAGTMGLVHGDSMSARFFHRLGASLLDRTICANAGAAALDATYGSRVGMHVERYADSRVILIWGSNSIASNLHFWSFAQQAKRAGAKLICIDPRRTETADRCQQHVALLPGTDGALALGMIREIDLQGWIDRDYVEAHTDGWPALRAVARAWTPERTAAVCGIGAAEARGLARDYATLRPAAIRLNYGMQRTHGGGSAVRLIAALPCLIGAWRDPAGGLLLSAAGFAPTDSRRLQRPDLVHGPTPRTVNMSTIGDALLADASPDFGPRIEALVVYNSNPVAVAPESPKVVRGFAREDLFTVVLEHFDVHKSYGHAYVLVNEPAIAPLGEARPNTAVFRALASRFGFTEACFRDDDVTIGSQAFGDAIDFERLRRDGWIRLPIADAPFAAGGFRTANGRAQFAPPSLGPADHVPPYESVLSAPALARRYPLAMISPPARHFLNSTFVNVRSLRSIEGEPLLEMHPLDAGARELADGQFVRAPGSSSVSASGGASSVSRGRTRTSSPTSA